MQYPHESQKQPENSTVRYIITKNLSIDSIQGFQPSAWQNRIVQVSELLDASYVDLDAFRAKGGKMLMFRSPAST